MLSFDKENYRHFQQSYIYTCSSPNNSLDVFCRSLSAVGTQPMQDKKVLHTSRQSVRLLEPDIEKKYKLALFEKIKIGINF